MDVSVYAGNRAINYRPQNVAKCCLKTIDEKGKDMEGDVVECRGCQALLSYRDGAWAWEEDMGDL